MGTKGSGWIGEAFLEVESTELAIYEKWRGRKRSGDDIQVPGLVNWMDIGAV